MTEFKKYFNRVWRKTYDIINKMQDNFFVKTNDCLESLHSRINADIGKGHPTLERLIDVLQKIDKEYIIKHEEYRQTAAINKRPPIMHQYQMKH